MAGRRLLSYGLTRTLGNAAAPTSNITLSYKPGFDVAKIKGCSGAAEPRWQRGCMCARGRGFKEAAGKGAFGPGQPSRGGCCSSAPLIISVSHRVC